MPSMRRQGPNDDMSSNDYSLEQPLKQVRTQRIACMHAKDALLVGLLRAYS
jgi:hypothetical protein